MRWSTSRQSWEERIGGVLLLTAAIVVAVWGTALPALQQSFLWALLLLTTAFLLRRGWLKLFGPVLFYDMVRLARRGRYILLRVGYAGILLFFLFINWAEYRHWGDAQQQYARMAQGYFYQFMIVQLVAVSLLTPAYVGGAIAEEKSRKTLEFMLATDLRNREIVLSKLASRLANLCMFVLVGLPILSILQFLGGIDPNLMLVGFAATLVTMIGIAGFSILCSVYFKKPRDAIVCSYLGPATYLAVGLVLALLAYSPPLRLATIELWSGGPTVTDAIGLFNSGNFIWAFIRIAESTFSRTGVGSILLTVLRDYAIFHLLIGLVATSWCVVSLRRIALKQANESPGRTKKRERRRPKIGARPVLWREVYVEDRARASWLWRILIGILVLLTVGSCLWMAVYELCIREHPHQFFAEEMAGWVAAMGTVVCCLALLAVAVRASTCISSERDRETFDFLLTTPLDSDTILWHKFLGCLISFRRALLWLAAIWVLGLLADISFLFDIALLLAVLLIYATMFIFIGLWFSMTCRSGVSATIWTISTVLIISVGHWIPSACCLTLASDHRAAEILAKCQAGVTPPFVIAFGHFAGFQIRRHDHWAIHRETLEFGFAALVGLAVYVLAAALFWHTALSPRFRQITHRQSSIRPER